MTQNLSLVLKKDMYTQTHTNTRRVQVTEAASSVREKKGNQREKLKRLRGRHWLRRMSFLKNIFVTLTFVEVVFLCWQQSKLLFRAPPTEVISSLSTFFPPFFIIIIVLFLSCLQ